MNHCADCGQPCNAMRCWQCYRASVSREKPPPVEDCSADWRELLPEGFGVSALDMWEP